MRKVRLMFGAFLAVSLLGIGNAQAQQASASYIQTMPPGPVNVGDTLPPAAQVMLLTLTNETTDALGDGTADYLAAVRVAFTPSCQAIANQGCPNANKDPGVFQMNATATGEALSSCSAVSFNVIPDPTDVNATGRLLFEPVATQLNGAINNVVTSLSVDSNVGFIQQNIRFLIQIDTEVMLVTAGQAGTTWTVTRGFLGTTAAAHADNAPVKQLLTLGPTDNSAGPISCIINFTGTVKKQPASDASATAGRQTISIAGGSFTNNVGTGQTFPWGATSETAVTGPDVTIAKAPVGGAITAGQNAVFTITVANNGVNATGAATNVVVSDTLPTGVTWSLQSPVTGCSILAGPPQSLSCTLPGPIAVGGSVQIVLTAPTTAQTPQCLTAGPFTNVAQLGGTNGVQFPEPVLSNQADISCTQIISNLDVTKTDGTATYTPGLQVVYTIVVTNNGPSAATGATISDTKPAQITTWQWVCSGGTGGSTGCDGTAGFVSTSPFTDTVNMPVGSTVRYVVTANTDPAATGNLVNTVTATPPQGEGDEATDTDTPAPVTNLVISKTDGQSSVPFGTNTTYSITVLNNGPSTSTGAILVDPVATGLTKVSVLCVAGNTCVTPPTIGQLEGGAFALPTIAPGSTYVLTVEATVTSLTGSVTNSASVTPPGGTTSTGSGCTSSGGIVRVFTDATDTCTSTDTNTVSYWSYSVQKQASANELDPNTPLTFTITVTNNGPADADGTIVTDLLPAGYSATSAFCTAGPSCPGGDLLGQLASGITLTDFPAFSQYVFTVNGTFTLVDGALTNTATACPPSVLAGQVSCQDGSTTVTVRSEEVPVPTLSEYALIMLMLLMAAAGALRVRRQQR